jgi:hypothetical protein
MYEICSGVRFGNEDLVCRMSDSLAHRGPDSEGDVFFTRGDIGPSIKLYLLLVLASLGRSASDLVLAGRSNKGGLVNFSSGGRLRGRLTGSPQPIHE